MCQSGLSGARAFRSRFVDIPSQIGRERANPYGWLPATSAPLLAQHNLKRTSRVRTSSSTFRACRRHRLLTITYRGRYRTRAASQGLACSARTYGVLVPSILSSGTRGGSRRHSLYYAMFEKCRIESQLETIPPLSSYLRACTFMYNVR